MHGFKLMANRLPVSLVAAALLAMSAVGTAAADAGSRVVASIKPVHSLVSAVMAGVGEPHLIMREAASHHSFNMRPSDAAVLQEARIVFLIDAAMESGLADAIETLAPGARVIELSAARGLVRRALRSGGAFEEDHIHMQDDHDDHDDGHDDHGNAKSGHDDHGDDDHGHTHTHDGHTHSHGRDDHDDDHDDHAEGPFDLHMWLDPVNAEAMTHMIADVLSGTDFANADRYADNAHELIHRLEDLTAEIAAKLEPVHERPFIVFHDGYRYFEDRFGLTAAGSAVVSPERSPGVKRIRELRKKVSDLGVVCLIDEPHFDRRLVDTVLEGTDVRSGTLDPMGSAIEDGPELYFTLLRNMADVFTECLAPSG